MILPGATIGIVGGGQLGQMIAQEAISMGFDVVVLDPTPDCPASRCATQIVADYDDVQAVAELASKCDVITYEFENVDAEALRSAAGDAQLPQGTGALEICQDRGAERAFLESVNVAVAPFKLVDAAAELPGALAAIGFPCVVKTRRGGYDGKGQVVLETPGDPLMAQALEMVERTPCIAEKWVPFEREISVIVAGNGSGEFRSFPVAENQHRDNILHRSLAPAPISDAAAESASRIALEIARGIGLVGVMGVEMFLLDDGEILVNELAPRPHNSGHYTIEACNLSQYAAHVRGICGWPIPEPRLLSSAIMTNVLGEDLGAALELIPNRPHWNFHFYGKAETKKGRKMGHITVLTDAEDEAF